MNLSALLLSFAFLQTALMPQNSTQFFVTPDTESELVFLETASPNESDASQFVLCDVNGTEIRRVSAESKKDAQQKRYTLKITVPQGYYELLNPVTEQAFGVVSLPAFCSDDSVDLQTVADPFFAIDGATSWLVRGDNFDQKREELVQIARRSGIGMIRERLSWSECQTKAGVENINFEPGRHYDSSRKIAQRHGVLVLELCHDAPDWMEKTASRYPKDMFSVQDSFSAFTTRWNRTWGGMEVWNEPDISFAANLPADQYTPLLKTIAYEHQNSAAEAEKETETGTRTPLVSGVMASYNRPWLETAAACGILENSDVFSFHTYATAPAVEKIYTQFQNWLRDSGQPTKPLWLTECGRPWTIGPGRPPQEQDLTSAIDIVMKGVEAKAFGITRYFPFVFPYYEERSSNFGMMSRDYTPLRSFAAYAQSVRVLAHAMYIGDWKNLSSPEGWTHGRMFALPNASETLVVFYAPTFAPRKLTLPCEILRAQRVTGENIPLDASKTTIQTIDGFVYVWVRKSDANSFLNADTPMRAMLAERSTKNDSCTNMKKNVSPIVLRYDVDEKNVMWNSEGYEFGTKSSEEIALTIVAANLSKETKTVPIQVRGFCEDTKIEAPQSLTIPAKGTASFVVRVVPGVDFMKKGAYCPIEITAEDSLLLKIKTKINIEELQARVSKTMPLNLRDLARWTPSSGSCDVLKFAESGETWVLMTHFTAGDRWVYPGYRLPESVNLANYDGVLVRARCWDCKKQTQIRFFAYQNEGAFFTSASIIPVNGEWNVVKIPFSSLTKCTAAGGSETEFHPEEVRKISLGGNTTQETLVLEVSDGILYKN